MRGMRCTLALLFVAAGVCWVRAQHDLAPEEPEEIENNPSPAPPRKETPPPKAPEPTASKKPAKPAEPAPQDQAPPKRKSAPVEEPKQQEPPPTGMRKYWMETAGSVVLFLYLIAFFTGKASNDKIAQAYANESLEVYKQNFHTVGLEDHNGKTQSIVQDAYHVYKMYASGRINCSSCSTYIELAKRQDALSAYLLFAFFPWEDIVRLEIPIDNVDVVSFCLCRKREQKVIHQAANDLRSFARPRKAEDVPQSLIVLADGADIASAILSESVRKLLKAHEKCIHKIHVGDEMPYNGCKKGIVASFKLPSKLDQMEEVVALVRMTMHLVDVIAQFKLSDKARQSVQETRREASRASEAQLRAEREQRMQQKKIDKKKAAEQEIEGLTKEQQRKREEKEYKKSLKSRVPKMKMLR